MTVNRRWSEEGQRISWRMKSARMLTGLTQESFSAQNGIPLMTIKCWEMGRAIPRQEGLASYLSAIKKHGIDVSFEWILYGSGSGPTYIEGTQASTRNKKSDHMEQQIALFQNQIRSKSLNPIVTKVSDDLMEPFYSVGDVVGGYYVSLDKLCSDHTPMNIQKSPWLLGNKDGDFSLAFLLVAEDSTHIFYRESMGAPIKKLSSSLVGRVCWRYSDIS